MTVLPPCCLCGDLVASEPGLHMRPGLEWYDEMEHSPIVLYNFSAFIINATPVN